MSDINDFIMQVQDQVYTVAVGAEPIRWAVQCDICDDIVSDETTDSDLVDKLEIRHQKTHIASEFVPVEELESYMHKFELDNPTPNPL